ncbi:FG-GAP repeat domain-containing protein [Streptomyces sp. NPDC003027]
MRRSLRRSGLALAALAAVAATVIAPPAAAADQPVASGSTVARPLTPVTGSKASLDYKDLTGLADTVALAPVGIETVRATSHRVGRASCFTDPGDEVLNSGSQGFCWDAEDTNTTDWMPQGVTSNTTPYAPVDGRRIVIASWYKGEWVDGKWVKNRASRITLADATDRNNIRYSHVMLVEPTGKGSFQRLKTHADAAVWYKNRLFIGSGQGYWVFDLDRFWKVDASRSHMGLGPDGVFGAENHTYVLPVVGKYHNDGKSIQNPDGTTRACGTTSESDVTETPCHAGASLDLSGPEPALVSTENLPRGAKPFVGYGGTIARWPLDPASGLLKRDGAGTLTTSAAAVLTSPILGAQGVVSRNGTYVIPAPCPEYVDASVDPNAVAMNGCIYRALPHQPVQLWKRTSKHIENVAYDPARDELWISNEHTDRVLERVPWPRFGGPLRLITDAGDITGDGKGDLLAADHAGELWRYDGDGSGGYGRPAHLGGGWSAMTKLVGGGDLDRDGIPDLLAVDNEGRLWRYSGNGSGGHTAPQLLGGGWNGIRLMANGGDVTGDGNPDLFAVGTDGRLYRYDGNGAGAHAPRKDLGGGWGVYSRIVGAGDLTSDGKPDLLAVDGSTQHMYRYDGNGAGGHAAPVDLGGGWTAFDALVGVGDLSGDGKGALLARKAVDGGFLLYAAAGNGTFAPPRPWSF